MATITPTVTITDNVPSVTWTGITTTTDTPSAFAIQDQAGLAMSVQFAGTFNGGTTAVLQGSNDGSTYTTLKDVLGNSVSATAAALFEVSSSVRYIKPSVSSGSADNVNVIVVLRG